MVAWVGDPSPLARGHLLVLLMGCRGAGGVCVFVVVGLCECLVRGRFQPLCGCWLGSPVVPRGTRGGGLGMLLIGLWAVFFFILFFLVLVVVEVPLFLFCLFFCEL